MTISSQIQAVVVAWQVYDITHDPLSLGLIGLAEALPFIGVALYAGHIADQLDRRRVSQASLVVLLGCAAALLTFNLLPGFLTRVGAWPFYAVIFVSGLARSFLQPARNALAAELVGRELDPNAVAWRSATWQTAAVIGPALGGLLYGFSGPRRAYVVQLALLAVSVLSFAVIHYERRSFEQTTQSIAESLKLGVKFVFSEPV